MAQEKTACRIVPSFELEATDVLQRLRSAFAEVIAAVPGTVSKAAGLQRALNIDMKMSWKAFKVYRYRMEYPVMRSTVVVRFDLPEPAQSPAVEAAKTT